MSSSQKQTIPNGWVLLPICLLNMWPCVTEFCDTRILNYMYIVDDVKNGQPNIKNTPTTTIITVSYSEYLYVL